MQLQFYKQIGSQTVKPVSIDSTSSRTVVYIRKNITRVTREDTMSKVKTVFWEYDEAIIPIEYYVEHIAEINLTFNAANNELNTEVLEMVTSLSERVDDLTEMMSVVIELLTEGEEDKEGKDEEETPETSPEKPEPKKPEPTPKENPKEEKPGEGDEESEGEA
jgi:hypothetical protein